MESWIVGAVITLLGVLIGSFLNVVIYRIPKGESIVFPSSHCTTCNAKLHWYHNIPLFSWLALRGKCAFCRASISIQYPLVELATGALWLALFLKMGLVWQLPFVAASFTALLALSAIDLKYFAVPDSVNFFALLAALIQPEFLQAGLNAAMAAFGLWALAKAISLALNKEAMGGADVIVAGTMAALLGFPGFFLAIFLSAILAIVPSLLAKDTMVPFVPFLALGTLIIYLFDHQANAILEWVIYG